ncbi:MAG: hypothetical protein QXQ81_09115 [Candidatus Thorarchaeota archaeon]
MLKDQRVDRSCAHLSDQISSSKGSLVSGSLPTLVGSAACFSAERDEAQRSANTRPTINKVRTPTRAKIVPITAVGTTDLMRIIRPPKTIRATGTKSIRGLGGFCGGGNGRMLMTRIGR